jgi:hypothetical protein
MQVQQDLTLYSVFLDKKFRNLPQVIHQEDMKLDSLWALKSLK